LTPDATEADIKKSWKIMRLRCHPDKNPDDPHATLRFQDLEAANRVLSDDAQRSVYDGQAIIERVRSALQALGTDQDARVQDQLRTFESWMIKHTGLVRDVENSKTGEIRSVGGNHVQVVPVERSFLADVCGDRSARLHEVKDATGCESKVWVDERTCYIFMAGPREGLEVAQQMIQEFYQESIDKEDERIRSDATQGKCKGKGKEKGKDKGHDKGKLQSFYKGKSKDKGKGKGTAKPY